MLKPSPLWILVVALLSGACGDEATKPKNEDKSVQKLASNPLGDKNTENEPSADFPTKGATLLIKAVVEDPAKLVKLMAETDNDLRALGVAYKLTVEKSKGVAMLFVAQTKDKIAALTNSKEVLGRILEQGTVKRAPPPILLQGEFISGGSKDLPTKTASLFATFNGIGEGFEGVFEKDEAVRESAGIIGYRVHRNLEDANMLVLEFIAADVPTLRSYLKNSQLGSLPSAPKGRMDFTIGDDTGRSLTSR
jgi:hypothetical protein